MNVLLQGPRTILELSDQEVDLRIWIEAFLKDRKATGRSERTIKLYREKLVKFLKFCDNRVISQITQITAGEIREFLIWLREQGHNPGGVHVHYRVLKAFLNFWELEIEPEYWKNPIRKVKGPKVPLEPLEPAKIENIMPILDTCKGGNYFDIRDAAIIYVLMDTGIRSSELTSIDLADVDTVKGSILIRRAKGGKFRTVFLGRKSRKMLRKYLRVRGAADPPKPLFLKRDWERMTYCSLKQLIKRRSGTAGVASIPLHAFRRFFALECLKNGMDVFSLQTLMGHSDLSVLRRYLKQMDDDLKEAHIRGGPVDRLI